MTYWLDLLSLMLNYRYLIINNKKNPVRLHPYEVLNAAYLYKDHKRL